MTASLSPHAQTASSALMALVTAVHHLDDATFVALIADMDKDELRHVLVNAVIRLDEAWREEALRCGVTPEAFLGIIGAQVARNTLGGEQ